MDFRRNMDSPFVYSPFVYSLFKLVRTIIRVSELNLYCYPGEPHSLLTGAL